MIFIKLPIKLTNRSGVETEQTLHTALNNVSLVEENGKYHAFISNILENGQVRKVDMDKNSYKECRRLMRESNGIDEGIAQGNAPDPVESNMEGLEV